MMRPADLRTESERGGIKKLIGKTKFPANFKEKVNMSKVNMETMAPWIQSEVEIIRGLTLTLTTDPDPDPTLALTLTLNPP